MAKALVRSVNATSRWCPSPVLKRSCNRAEGEYRRQCDFMLEEGALPHQVDAATKAFDFAMGICETQDIA